MPIRTPGETGLRTVRGPGTRRSQHGEAGFPGEEAPKPLVALFGLFALATLVSAALAAAGVGD